MAMKDFGRILFVVAFIVVLGLAAKGVHSISTEVSLPEISISFLNQDPNPAEPGHFFKARYKVENIGLYEARDIQIEVLPEYPFTLYQDSPLKTISGLSSRQKGTDAAFIEYNLKVDDMALPGDYSLKLRYRTAGGTWVTLIPSNVSVKQQEVVVSLSSVAADPQTVKPGERTTLTLYFDNLANTPIRYLTVKLGLISTVATTSAVTVTELPFSPISTTNEIVFPLVRPGEKVKAEFNMITDADAKAKVYKIPVTYSYLAPSNANFTKLNYVSINVADKPDVTAGIDTSTVYKPGMRGEVIMKFVNKGLNNIKLLHVSLKPGPGYVLLSPQDVYVGNIDSDDYETVEYKVYIDENAKDKVTFPFVLSYKDANNADHIQQSEVELKLYSRQEAIKLGLEKKSNAWIYLAIVVLAAALIGYFRMKKSRKLGKAQ